MASGSITFAESVSDYESVLSYQDSFISCPGVSRTERAYYPFIFEKTRPRFPKRCYFIGETGPPQSGKTTHTCMQISAIFTDKNIEPEEKRTKDSVLIIYITQSINTDSVRRTYGALKNFEEVTKYIDEDNILMLEDIGKLNKEKNGCIISFHSAPKEKKIIDFYRENKEKWSDVFILIDETDQGGVKGTTDRVTFVKSIYDIAMPMNVAMRCAFVTATLANLADNMKEQREIFNPMSSTQNTGLNKIKFDIYHIEPDENYVGSKYIIDNKCWMDMTLPYESEYSKEGYMKVVERVFYERINAVDEKNKKYALVSNSIYKEDHRTCARKLIDCGFNASLVMNSENKKAYDGFYKNQNDEIKTWQIPFEDIEKKAKKGELKYRFERIRDPVTRIIRNEKIPTGINSQYDIIPVEYLQALFYPDIDELHPKYEKLTKLFEAMELPEDFPILGLKLAIVGGKMFDRGGNFQEPTTNLAPGLMAIYEESTSQKYALTTQRVGRMFGNTKKCYENMGIHPILISTSDLFTGLCVNDELTSQVADTIKQNGIIARTLFGYAGFAQKNVWKNIEKKARREVTDPLVKEQSELRKMTKEEARRTIEIPETHDTREDDDKENVKVPITSEFIELLNDRYNSDTKVGFILKYLKNIERPITLADFYVGMRNSGYNGNDKNILYHVKIANGISAIYSGYWNYSTRGNTYIYMPKAIKNILD
jgi:hypothetical protein